MSVDVGRALALTFLGAAGTALGGLLVVVQPKMDFKKLGALQVGGMRSFRNPVAGPDGRSWQGGAGGTRRR